MSKKVLYVQYVNPAAYPPLEHSSIILANAGWEVLFLGITSKGDSQILKFPDHPHIQVKQLPSTSIGWRQKLHYLYFMLWVLIKVLRWHPDWIYASDLLSCPATLLVSFISQIQIIYHEHDAPYEKEASTFIHSLLFTRRKLAQRADICILPNEQRAQHFTATLSPKNLPVIVWNCPRQDEVANRSKTTIVKNLSAWYHGSIVPQRVPLSLLDAIAELPPQISLYITGYSTIGHANYVIELRERIKQLGISNRVIISDPLSRYLLLKECQKHTVGISFMPPLSDDINMQHMVGASNKAFDYMACGLALLVSDLPEWDDLYVKPEYGLACNPQESKSIVAALHWFWENPDKREMMGRQGQLRILYDWNYETQFSPVFEQMNS